MTETKVRASNDVSQTSLDVHPPNDCASLPTSKLNGASRSASPSSGEYLAVSPKGLSVTIPKELFIALSDFIKTRKCPGSITIQFRSGEISCVESVAKKTYRNSV
jgi:hypothetical protein